MKAVMLFLLITISHSLALSQVNGSSSSLKVEADTVELKEKLELAEQIRLFDPDSAHGLFRNLLAETDDRHLSIRLSVLKRMAAFHFDRVELDSALYYAEILLEESERNDYLKGKMGAFILFAIVNLYSGEDSLALEELSKADELARQMNDTLAMSAIAINRIFPNRNLGNEQAAFRAAQWSYDLVTQLNDSSAIASSARHLADRHYARGEVNEAIELVVGALKVFEKKQDQRSVAACYNNLGVFYRDQLVYDKALDYFIRATSIVESLEMTRNLATGFQNISFTYQLLDDLDKSIEYAFKSLEVNRQLNSDKGIGMALQLIGEAYLKKHEVSKAIAYLEEAVEHQKKIKESQLMAELKGVLSRAYYESQDYSTAIKLAEQALSITRSQFDDRYAYETMQTLHKCYAAQGMFEKAYQTSVEMSAVKDSLTVAEEKKTLFRKVYEYEYEKKALADSLAANQEKLILELAHQDALNASNQTRNILFGAGALLLLAAGGGWSRASFVRKANKRLKEARDRAEESERFKQRFLANMSHEIRTPMNAVLGMSQLALDTDLNAKQRSYLEGIKNSSETLLVIVNDILDLSKLEQGKLTIEQIPFSIREQLNIVHQTLQYKAEEKGLQYDTEIGEDVPQMVVGDPARLTQVVMNLVANAIKFTEKGRVHLKVSHTSKNRIKFSVQDSGIGIPKDKQKRLFQSFQQADNTTSRKYGGTGLGLAISKDLVELQGGSISIESAEGVGSVFSFDLELLPAESQVKPFDSNNDVGTLSGIKLLVAEDNKYNQIVIIDTLETLIDGAKITLVENGEEALAALEKGQFDAVLMDAHMPEMDGIEAARKIRAQGHQIPIIALTASVLKEEIENCLAAGMNDSLPKPFRREDLLNVLGKHFSAGQG